MPLRWASDLRPQARLGVHEEREELIAQLAAVDAELRALQAQRRQIVDELRDRRDRLWPRVKHCHGRRPPAVDAPPLPPMVNDPYWLRGRQLRATCVAILRSEQAELSLVDLHAALHVRGYAVDAKEPVRVLSDAMGYEVEQGRAERVRRGVYKASEIATPRPRRRRYLAADAVVRYGPEEWFNSRAPASDEITLSSQGGGTLITGDVHSPP